MPSACNTSLARITCVIVAAAASPTSRDRSPSPGDEAGFSAFAGIGSSHVTRALAAET